MADKSGSGELVQSNVGAGPAKIVAEIVIRDKDGNVKYEGPLEFNVVKESEDGSHTLDRS